MRTTNSTLVVRIAATLMSCAVAACSSIGPVTVARDRVDYITAVAESWKDQTLLNIVRMRYGDAPGFVDVSSIIGAYAIQGQLAAGAAISSNLTNTAPWNLVTLGGNATYLDRPTITYTPIIGDKFAKSLLRPIPPAAVFELIQAGYAADSILQITTRAINGIYNRSSRGERAREPDPEFYPLLDALRRLQLSGVVSLRLEKRGADEIGILNFADRQTADVGRDLRFVEKTLGVTLRKNGELTLAYGAIPHSNSEITMLTRSMVEILLEVAAGIKVPGEHITAGSTSPSGRLADAPDPRDRPLVNIMSGARAPERPFAAVQYGDTWYWIDNNDLSSKRVFSFLMIFFSLAETGVTPAAPVLTIPAN